MTKRDLDGARSDYRLRRSVIIRCTRRKEFMQHLRIPLLLLFGMLLGGRYSRLLVHHDRCPRCHHHQRPRDQR
jgi:hypothetical protein